MSKSWPLLTLAVLGAVVAVFCLVAFDWSVWACHLPAGEEGKVLTPGIGGCVEFWLNRYQALLGAIVAAAAAAIAWIAVQKQIKTTERQIDIGLGKIDPDFYAHGGQKSVGTNISNMMIEIKNNNRLDLSINLIDIIEPDWLIVIGISRSVDNKIREERFSRVGDRITLDVPMAGTEPSASEASRMTLIVRAVARKDKPFGDVIAEIALVKIRIWYRLREQNSDIKSVELSCPVEIQSRP